MFTLTMFIVSQLILVISIGYILYRWHKWGASPAGEKWEKEMPHRFPLVLLLLLLLVEGQNILNAVIVKSKSIIESFKSFDSLSTSVISYLENIGTLSNLFLCVFLILSYQMAQCPKCKKVFDKKHSWNLFRLSFLNRSCSECSNSITWNPARYRISCVLIFLALTDFILTYFDTNLLNAIALHSVTFEAAYVGQLRLTLALLIFISAASKKIEEKQTANSTIERRSRAANL